MTDHPDAEPGAEHLDEEVLDDEAAPTLDIIPLDRAYLTSPEVLGALGGVVLGFLVLIWPNRSDRILARLVGLALLWLAVTMLVRAFGARPVPTGSVVVALAFAAGGAFLLLSPNQSEEALGRMIGVGAVVAAARTGPDGERHVARVVVLVAAGLLLFVFPRASLALVTTVAAAVWIVFSTIVLIASLDSRRVGTTSYRGAYGLVMQWLDDRPKTATARQALYDKILFDGPHARRRTVRFFSLMTFASLIAATGVIGDSTAVVIGAMLIAPLMTPLMATALALVMGWPNRLARSGIIAAGGIVTAIVIGVLLGLMAPMVIDTATNTQIVSRSSPTVLDLFTAVAAGAAGAYALSRPDVSDSLPGVAIAISLVPPLSVVGIAYSQADWAAGNGALLLFTTNMVAILTIGGLMFIVTGVTPLRRVAASQKRLTAALAGVAVLSVLVVGSLFLNGTRAAAALFEEGATEAAVDEWLSATEAHRVVDVTTVDDKVTAVVVGPSEGLPPAAQLAARLSDALGRSITADVRHVVEERTVATGPT